MEQKKKANRKIIILVILIAVVVAAIAFVVLWRDQTDVETTETVAAETEIETDTETEKWQEGIIQYNGKYYEYNNQIKSYLFLGIDKSGEVMESTLGLEGGQSDVIFLLVQDKASETMSLIAINRNTMTEIDTYGIDNNYVSTIEAQICLQHAYGDGGKQSCTRTVDAVSNLLYDIPISGYYAMNLDGISILNDAIGGVEVEVLEDIDALGVQLTAGETVTLTGEQAYAYVRWRDTDVFDSATMRLQRQEQYIEGMIEQIRELANNSSSVALNLYESLSDYSVTNIAIADLIAELADYEYSGEMYELPGETVMGEEYEEYYVDEEELYALIIEIFYNEVDNPNPYEDAE